MHGIVGDVLHLLVHHWFSISSVTIAAWLFKNRYHKGLNKYPGPFLASLTDWWRFFDVLGRRPERTHIELHRRHGHVVRLGPNTLSFADPEALKTIYGLNKGLVKTVAKGHRLPSLFSTTDNHHHAQLRRCVNNAFAMSSLLQYEPFVDNMTRLFLDQTERCYVSTKQTCDFTRWLQFYAFDVIGKITYSKSHGFIEKNEDVEGIVGFLASLFSYLAPVGQIPFLDRLWRKNPIYLKLSTWGLVDSTFPVTRFAYDRMVERVPGFGHDEQGAGPAKPPPSAKAKSPDLLSKFIAARAARPDSMTDTTVLTMAVSMAFAGSETTAISLAAVFYYLLRNPRCLARLTAEVDGAARAGALGDYETGLVAWHEAQRLPYLDAVVKEAFRLHPAPGLPLERIVPAGGLDIAGRAVPAGTIVGCSAWVIHRNQDIFGEDVDAFRPERWLVDEAALDKGAEARRISQMNGTMLQFGMGSRTCIGKNISLLEIYKLVPSFLRKFTLRLDDPSREWELFNAWFVKQNNFYTRFEVRDIVQPDGGKDGPEKEAVAEA